MQSLFIIAFSTLAAIVYGIAHDLITTRVCLEYFTIAHPPILGHTHSPTLLAIGWGVIATWWVGLPLGVVLAFSSRIGSMPKLEARQLIKPLAIGIAVMLPLAMAAGFYGYNNDPCPPAWQGKIPPEHQQAFMFNAYSHLTSYALGPILAIVLCVWSIIIRVRENFRAVQAAVDGRIRKQG